MFDALGGSDLGFGATESATPSRTASVSAPKPRKSGGGFGPALVWYACGIITGIIVMMIVAKRGPVQTGLEKIPDYGVSPGGKKWRGPDPKASAVPPGQKVRLGEKIRAGGIEVTALGVERRKVTEVRTALGVVTNEKRASDGECLVLRLRIKNVTPDIQFAPLDKFFLRPNVDYPAYTYIELPNGSQVGMYELAPYSEFDVEGQSAESELSPGQSLETAIVAVPGSPGKAKGTMVWRVQLRGGGVVNPKQPGEFRMYSTVIGVEFSADQVRAVKA